MMRAWVLSFLFLSSCNVASSQMMTIPGHHRVPVECVHSTDLPIDQPLENLLPSHCFDAPSMTEPMVNPQVYALDVNVEKPSGFRQLNASWTVPQNPSTWYGFGYVNYFWPGFKAKKPVIGYPVLQPVLQYGQNGASWEVQSWFVNQQSHGAASANGPPIRDVQSGDIIDSSMTLRGGYWTILATNRRNQKVSNLTISFEAAGNTTYDYAMFVYENILTPVECKQLPADEKGVTFTNISIDGNTSKVDWAKVHGRTDCSFAVDIDSATNNVEMRWAQKQNAGKEDWSIPAIAVHV